MSPHDENAAGELQQLIELSENYSKQALLEFAGWILIKYGHDDSHRASDRGNTK